MAKRKKGVFQKGPDERRGHGGARPGAGRKPNWFKEQCAEIFDRARALEYIEKVITDVKVKPHVTMSGETVMTTADVKEHLMAIEMLKEWAHGKSPLPLRATDGNDADVGGVILLPVQAAGRAGVVIDGRNHPSKSQ